MTRFYVYLTIVFLTYIIYGFSMSQVDLLVLPREIQKIHPNGYYTYKGVLNVRTSRSNGLSDPQQVIKEARAAGVDFLILTDSNFYDQSETFSGYHGNLLVADEREYSYLDSRMILIHSDRTAEPQSASDSHLLLTDLLSQESGSPREVLLLLAQPFNPQPTWTGPYPAGLDGIEVLNPKSIAERAWIRSKLSVFWSLLIYPFNSRLAFLRLFREPIEESALWDFLNSKRPTAGFAGSDASARAIPWAGYLMKFPSYQRSFELVGNHVLLNSELTGNFPKDRKKIFTALKQGHFFFSLDLLGDPRGFYAHLKSNDQTYLMGSRVAFSKGQILEAQLPAVPRDFFEMVVIKDGEAIFKTNEPHLQFPIPAAGIYRVLVRVIPTLPIPDGKKWITWIYTNSFFVD